MSARFRTSGCVGVEERERRAHVRRAIQTQARIVLPDRESPVRAVGRDLSWDGIRLSVPTAFPALDRFQLILPWVHGRTLTMASQCVRVQATDAWHSAVAARFVSLSLRDHARLERLLVLLGRREPDALPALARRIEVVVNDLASLDQALHEIATGDYTIHRTDARPLHQGIRFILVSSDLPDIQLRARVIDVSAPTRCTPSEAPANRLDTLILCFEHPKPLLRSFVDARLEKLLCAQLAGTAHWPRNAASIFPRAKPVDNRRAEKGWLEREFPDLIDRIVACWGDSVAFRRLFRELILGDVGRPGGWSEGVWAELTWLQAIHARVFAS